MNLIYIFGSLFEVQPSLILQLLFLGAIAMAFLSLAGCHSCSTSELGSNRRDKLACSRRKYSPHKFVPWFDEESANMNNLRSTSLSHFHVVHHRVVPLDSLA